MGSHHDVNDEIDENDDEQFYKTPQIFLRQLFRLYSKGMIDEKNIRDQVYLMVMTIDYFTSI